MSRDSIYLFEQTDFSLRFARCAGDDHALRIEELKEVSAEEGAAFIASLPSNSLIVCASRPKERGLHLASVEEAKRHAGFAGVRKFAELSFPGTSAAKSIAAVKARDGSPPTDAPWLLSTSTEVESTMVVGLRALKSKVLENISATLATAGAFAGSAKSTMLLIEVGELGSHAMLVGSEGVLSAGPVPLDLLRIGDAVQTELKLKFRGSAVKLFLNTDYDFTEAGPKIATRLAEAMKSDLGRFLVDRPAPTELFVAGLPATQRWFGQQLALALGLASHSPDLKKWTAAAGISFATPDLAASATLSWFPLLSLAKSHVAGNQPSPAPWQPKWEPLEVSVSTVQVSNAAASAVSEKPIASASIGQPPAPVLPTKPPTPAAAPAKNVAATPAAPVVPLPTGKSALATPAPKPTTAVTDVKSAKSLIAAAAAKAPLAKTPSTPTPANVSGSSVSRSPTPPAQKPAETPFSRASTPPTTAYSTRNFAAPRLLALLGLAACIVGAGFFYLNSQSKATAQLAFEKEQAEQRMIAAAEKARLAEQKAQEEADARQKLEAEYAQKLLQSETARLQAESEALAQTAARLANARGSLVITTNPAGARVTVGNLPPKDSPATFTDIRIGTYPVSITLPHHEEVKLDLDVAENATTESGVISLVALIGSLRINTELAGASYELRPANALLIDPASRRSGVTPAALDDLAPGDYSVTLAREGWNAHTQVVSIARGATTHLRWAWPNGIVKVSSTPAGATVMRDGSVLGVTPLTLADQPPGEINYELVMDHYEPLHLVAQVAGGEISEIAGEFKAEDRLYTIDEIDRRPDPIGEKQPELPYYLTLENGRVEIELVVNRDGSTRNLTVLNASNADMGKYCLESVAKWRFKPGIKQGEPVNVTMKLPFVFKASRS